VLSTKEVEGFSIRYGQGLLQIRPPRSLRKCFYCFKIDYLSLFCLKKTEDKKKRLILVDKFIVRFVNKELIPIEHNMSIKGCVRKYLLLSIVVMI